MPTDEKKLPEGELGIEVTPESEIVYESPIDTEAPTERIKDQVQDLHFQIQQALGSLPGIHEDPDTLQELENLKAELSRIENSFLARVTRAVANSVEVANEWQKVKGVELELAYHAKKYQKDSRKKNHKGEFVDAIPFPFQRLEEISSFIQKSVHDPFRWQKVEGEIDTLCQFRTYGIKFFFEAVNGTKKDDQKVIDTLLEEALKIWKLSVNPSRGLMEDIESIINLYTHQTYTNELARRHIEKNSEEGRNLAGQIEQLRMRLFEQETDIGLYNRSDTRKLLQSGLDSPARQSCVARVNFSRKQLLSLDREKKEKLFLAYFYHYPKSISHDIDVFQDQFELLSPQEVNNFFVHSNQLDIEQILSYIPLTQKQLEILYKKYIRNREEFDNTLRTPLQRLTNGHLFGTTQEQRNHIVARELEPLSATASFHEYAQRLEFLTQIISHPHKYKDIDPKPLQEAVYNLVRAAIEQSAIVKIKSDNTIRPEECIQILERASVRNIFTKQQEENLKQCFFARFHNVEAMKKPLKEASPAFPHPFLKKFFDIDMLNDGQQEMEKKFIQKIKTEGNLRMQIDSVLLSAFIRPPEDRSEVVDKILAEGDSEILHEYVDTCTKRNFTLYRDTDEAMKLAQALISRGDARDLAVVTKDLFSFLSDDEKKLLQERVLHEGDASVISEYLAELKNTSLLKGEEYKPFTRKFVQRANEHDIAHELTKSRNILLYDQEEILEMYEVILQGETYIFNVLETRRNDMEPAMKRKFLDTLFKNMSAHQACHLIVSHDHNSLLDSTADVEICINTIKNSKDYETIFRLIKFYLTQDKNITWYLPLNTQQLEELADAYINNGGPINSERDQSKLIFDRCKLRLQNPNFEQSLSFILNIRTDQFFQDNQKIFLELAKAFRKFGLLQLAKISHQIATSDTKDESKFSTLIHNFKQVIELYRDYELEFRNKKYEQFSDQEKISSTYFLVAAQEGIANAHIRSELSTFFANNPCVFSTATLKSVPKESYAVLPLMKEGFLFSEEQIQQVAGEFFSGQVLKKSTDRDRFISFLVEAKDNPWGTRSFLEIVTPIMKTFPEAKKRILTLTQTIRSFKTLEGDFDPRIRTVNTHLAEVQSKYQAFCADKRQEWEKPLQGELKLLESISPQDEADPRKKLAKIKKKQEQIQRGPEVREQVKWNKEYEVTLLQQLDSLVDEYENKIPELFQKHTGVKLNKQEIKKFFGEFKDPSLVLVYLGKLQAYKGQTNLFRAFIESVAKGKFPEVRYKYRKHLDTVFGKNERLERLWKMNSRLEQKVYADADEEKVGKEVVAKQRIKEFLSEAVRHNHVSGDYARVIHDYLEAGNELARKKLRAEYEGYVKNLPSSEERNQKEKTTLAIYNTIRLLNLKSSQLKEGILKEKIGEGVKETKIQDLFGEIRAAFAENSPFQDNINDMSQVAGEAQEDKQKQSGVTLQGLRAEESENPDLLLRMGTDVLGSCQNVNGVPDHNMNLISYMMDGKIKVIFVRDDAGDMVSRAVMRILYDEKAKKPVINLEQSYHRSDAPVNTCNTLLFRLAQEKAQKMGVELVISAKLKPNEELQSYDGVLRSYGGPGDSEYVDNIGGSQRNQEYKIPGNRVYHIDTSKSEKLELSSEENYEWESNAA